MLTGWHLFSLSSIPVKSFESIGHWSEIRKWRTIDGDQGTHFSVVMLNYVHSSGELRKIHLLQWLQLRSKRYLLCLFLSSHTSLSSCFSVFCLLPCLTHFYLRLFDSVSFSPISLFSCAVLSFFHQWHCKYLVIFISLFIPFSLGVIIILGVLYTI